jgi:hypothetical protein
VRQLPLPWNREIEGGFLRYMDDATHDVYSPIFRVALASPVLAEATGVEPLAADTPADQARQGGGSLRGLDRRPSRSQPLPRLARNADGGSPPR